MIYYRWSMPNLGMSVYEPSNEEVRPPAMAGAGRTKIPLVIGVLHLCLGAVSTVSVTIGLIQGGRMSDKLGQALLGVEAQGFQVSGAAIEQLTAVDVPIQIADGMDLVASLLMVIAGIGLVRYVRWGRQLSNCYVATVLATKVLSLSIWLVVATPFFTSFVESNSQLEVIGVVGIQSVVLVSIRVGGLYAVFSAIMINLKRVRFVLS